MVKEYIIKEKIDYGNSEELFNQLNKLLKKEKVKVVTKDVVVGTALKGILRYYKKLYPDKLILDIELPEINTETKGDNKKSKDSFLDRVGNSIFEKYEQVLLFLIILTEMLYHSLRAIFDRRFIVKGALYKELYQIGYQAITIVTLLSFLIGITISMQAAVQLVQFGGQNYLALLIGVSMFKELGPLITAIIISGRIGSSISAEIGTMVVMEEVDALQTMGILPFKFILTPKFWAFTFSMPVLTMLANFAGIFGGLIIALAYDVPPMAFMDQLIDVITLSDVAWGVAKALSFAWVILSVAAYKGFKVRGGADAVGKATTESVVISIFLVVFIDALFSFILYT